MVHEQGEEGGSPWEGGPLSDGQVRGKRVDQTRPILCLGVTEMAGSRLAKEAVGLLRRGSSTARARGNLSPHLTSRRCSFIRRTAPACVVWWTARRPGRPGLSLHSDNTACPCPVQRQTSQPIHRTQVSGSAIRNILVF